MSDTPAPEKKTRAKKAPVAPVAAPPETLEADDRGVLTDFGGVSFYVKGKV